MALMLRMSLEANQCTNIVRRIIIIAHYEYSFQVSLFNAFVPCPSARHILTAFFTQCSSRARSGFGDKVAVVAVGSSVRALIDVGPEGCRRNITECVQFFEQCTRAIYIRLSVCMYISIFLKCSVIQCCDMESIILLDSSACPLFSKW